MKFIKVSDDPFVELSIDIWSRAKIWVRQLEAEVGKLKCLTMMISTLQDDRDIAFIMGGNDTTDDMQTFSFDLDGLIECHFYFDGPNLDLTRKYRVRIVDGRSHVEVE